MDLLIGSPTRRQLSFLPQSRLQRSREARHKTLQPQHCPAFDHNTRRHEKFEGQLPRSLSSFALPPKPNLPPISENILSGCRFPEVRQLELRRKCRDTPCPLGEVAERPIVQHWKCCVWVTGPGVRIPLSPLILMPLSHKYMAQRLLRF